MFHISRFTLRHKLTIITIGSLFAATIPGVILLYQIATTKYLEYSIASLSHETEVQVSEKISDMRLAESSLVVLSDLLKKSLALPSNANESEEFDQLTSMDVHGVIRNKKELFDGKVDAGLFIAPGVKMTDQEKRIKLRAMHVLSNFGANALIYYDGVWFDQLNKTSVIFWRRDPNFIYKLPPDHDYTKSLWDQLASPKLNPKRIPQWTPAILESPVGSWVVSVVYPVDIDGKWQGIVGHDIALDDLLKTFRASDSYAGSEHFLIDGFGNYILAGRWQQALEAKSEEFKPDLSSEPQLQAILTGKKTSKTGDVIRYGGHDYAVFSIIINKLGWHYYRLIPIDQVLAPMGQVFMYIVLLLIFVGLVVALIIRFASNSLIIRPIQRITESVLKFGAGNLSQRNKMSRQDELGQLSKVFNNMADEIQSDIANRKLAETDLRIAAIAFESQEGMLVTDANNVILRVNQAFTNITGYTAEEVFGKNPRILSSGRHDAAFYSSMWKSIGDIGLWSGEIWNRRKSGAEFPEYLTITAVKDADGIITNYVATLIDITERKQAEDEIQHLAFYDPLTRLPNRRLLIDRLNQALASSTRSGRDGALLLLDLDHFKNLNDTMGHDVGDTLLKQVAERLTSCVREGDTVARLGGDEFVLVLQDLSESALDAAAQAETISDKILKALNQPYLLGKNKHHNSVSIGVTLFNDNQSEIEELLRQADIAMYQAKKAGRNKIRFFDPKMQETINTRVSLESELKVALAENQFQLNYQIQVDHLGRPLGAEALIRWIHPERGVVSPFYFIPLAEETDLILPIGEWVLETACAQLNAWQQDKVTCDLTISINVSAKQFGQVDFVEKVQASLKRYSIKPKHLKLELTESLLLENIDNIIKSMIALEKIGVEFSLDDFGTGYSSLQYLKMLPMNQLKIDQSFVRDIVTDSSDRSIVRTIISMAKSLGFEVIAEGVETENQQKILLKKGCKRFQGYLFGRPVPIEEFEVRLREG